MLIILNNETLTRNIEYDHKKGSNAGDLIINQNINEPKENEYKLFDFDIIPNRDDLLQLEELQSKKSNSKVHKVFIFDKFEVNGKSVKTESKFILFIRESGSNPTKLRLICQGKFIKLEE